MTRYEYKFVRVELQSGVRTDTPKEDYQKIVHDHAKEGWRLFQIFAPPTSAALMVGVSRLGMKMLPGIGSGPAGLPRTAMT